MWPGLGTTTLRCKCEKFSTDSIIRDVAEFTALAAKHNIKFNGQSAINDKWHEAVTALADGDYKKAQGPLRDVRDIYGDHYLVASLSKTVDEQVGSTAQQLARVAVLVFIVLLL